MLKRMKGTEFIKKILQGERDFREITLEKGFDFVKARQYNELDNYLRSKSVEFERESIILNKSYLIGLKSFSLSLPYVNAVETDFSKSNLQGSDFRYGELGSADFSYSNLTDLYFVGADLSCSRFYKANVKGAKFNGTKLWGTHLVNVKNLELGIGLGNAAFEGTIVTKKEKAIIKKALNIEKLLRVVKV